MNSRGLLPAVQWLAGAQTFQPLGGIWALPCRQAAVLTEQAACDSTCWQLQPASYHIKPEGLAMCFADSRWQVTLHGLL